MSRAPLLLGALLAVVGLVGLEVRADTPSPHGRSDRCTACHTAGPGVAPSDISATCRACHPTADMHPVDMAPRRVQVADATPLDAAGKVTCATCHAEPAHAALPGQSDLADLEPPWFRGGPHASTTAFCSTCHTGRSLARVNPHTHPPRGEARDGSCSACHSAVPLAGAPPDKARLRLAPAATCSTCHPSLPHHGAATHLGRPLPQESGLTGADGRIACFTCHDVHRAGPSGDVKSRLGQDLQALARADAWAGLPADAVFPGTEPGSSMLRRPLEGGALCVACHRQGAR